MLETARNIFIIHTKADDYEAALVERLKDELSLWGLSAWVYEDWEWETEVESKPEWRSSGGRLDPVRYMAGDPMPFKHRSRKTQPDREALANIYDKSKAIVLIAPRAVSMSEGTWVEVDTLNSEPHPPVIGVYWEAENLGLLRDVGVCFEYEMVKPWSKDFAVPRESITRAAWLVCMMGELRECGPMGVDLFRQLARSDALLNKVARFTPRPLSVPLEPQAASGVALPEEATAQTCARVIQFWEGGPGLTAQQRTSRKPPQRLIDASRLMRWYLSDWVRDAQARFPVLREQNAARSVSLGAAKMRLGLMREAVDEFTRGLEAKDAGEQRVALLLNRALAWSQMGFPAKSIADYSTIIAEADAGSGLLATAYYNRALQWESDGHDSVAAQDLEAVVAAGSADPSLLSLALSARARLKLRQGKWEDAIADFDEVISHVKAPAESRLQALLNRGHANHELGRYAQAIADYDRVLADWSKEPHQVTLALFNRALARTGLGDFARGIEDLEEVLAQPKLNATLRAEVESRLASLRSANG